jgi:hypothetical protein
MAANMANKENHKLIEIELMDAFYGEKDLLKKTKDHLDICLQCNAFWKQLHTVREELSTNSDHIEIDERVIKSAFSKADKIKALSRSHRDLVIFSCFIFVILCIVIWFAYNGFTIQIITIQAILVIAAPLTLPLLIWKRLAKEGNH